MAKHLHAHKSSSKHLHFHGLHLHGHKSSAKHLPVDGSSPDKPRKFSLGGSALSAKHLLVDGVSPDKARKMSLLRSSILGGKSSKHLASEGQPSPDPLKPNENKALSAKHLLEKSKSARV